jgi:hypothetical protein
VDYSEVYAVAFTADDRLLVAATTREEAKLQRSRQLDAMLSRNFPSHTTWLAGPNTVVDWFDPAAWSNNL